MRYVLASGLLLGCGVFLWMYTASEVFYTWTLTDDQLSYARMLTERTPLMAIAGTSPEKLRDAVRALQDVQEKLADAQSDPRDAELIRGGFYPIRFLDSLAALEEKRLAFIESGTASDLRAYDTALDDAIDVYRADLARFREAFLEAVPDDAPAYVMGASVVTRPAILNAIDVLAEGIESTARLIERRRACIAGNAEYCDVEAPAYPSVSIPESESISISAAERTVAETIQTIYATALSHMTMHVFEMSKGSCTSSLPGAGVFALMERDSSLRPLYLGDLRLVKSNDHIDLPFYAYFAERGIEYVPSTPFAPYMCPEFALEFARLLGLRALAEHEWNTSNVPPSFGVQWKNNSTYFDEVVRYAVYVGDASVNATRHGAPGALDVMTLFYTRSAFLALYLAHNPSVAGEHGTFFAPHDIPLEEQPFVYYSTLQKTPGLVPALVKGYRAFDEVHGVIQQ